MTREEILEVLEAEGLPFTPYFGGANYAKPTWEWVIGPLYNFMKARLWSEGLDTWIVKFECRDFARIFCCYAQECFARDPNSPKGMDAFATAEVWFMPDASRRLGPVGERHAINAVVTENGIQYIDPQNFIEWKMSQSELASIYFLRF